MSRLIDLNLRPDERTLRHFGFIALAGFDLLAACAWYEVCMFRGGLGGARAPLVALLLGLGLGSALCSLVYPKANRVLYVTISLIGYPFGLLLSYVILGLLFFGLFAPLGLVLRLLRRDPLQRGFVKDAQSYWSRTDPRRDKHSYFRQF